jgi:hypothetical protein
MAAARLPFQQAYDIAMILVTNKMLSNGLSIVSQEHSKNRNI